MKLSYVVTSVIGIIIAMGGWYLYDAAYGGSHWSRTLYTGTAKIELVTSDELIKRLEAFGCRTSVKQGEPVPSCVYSVDPDTGTVDIRVPLAFGPTGYKVNGNTISINLDVKGGKSLATFEEAIQDEIHRYGDVVKLIRGTAVILSAKDASGIIY